MTHVKLTCEALEDRALMSASPWNGVVPPPAAGPILTKELTGTLAHGTAPMPQTREHILLARQVGVPAASLTKVGTGHLILPTAIGGDNVWQGPVTMDHSGPMPQTREHILLARQVGVSATASRRIYTITFGGSATETNSMDSRPGSGVLKAADDYFGETAMLSAGRVRVSSGSL